MPRVVSGLFFAIVLALGLVFPVQAQTAAPAQIPVANPNSVMTPYHPCMHILFCETGPVSEGINEDSVSRVGEVSFSVQHGAQGAYIEYERSCSTCIIQSGGKAAFVSVKGDGVITLIVQDVPKGMMVRVDYVVLYPDLGGGGFFALEPGQGVNLERVTNAMIQVFPVQ